MKKRKANLERKLTLNKETVANLNMQQQQQIAGGAGFIITRPIDCQSFAVTCDTAQMPTGPCELCNGLKA
ncbi:class I lanthipeptide [Chitinophaga flava]|uniref:Class I lanthipeptide n=1 Tax=Chitinophaga flava TaxID=2259036 RepID=A0A365XVG4_9BACT|nr:class I lanthipeptide [Chitinophaga flava]RBL90150.1 hypothetical protein DF182_27165 [Chitinophaga flava]